MSHWADIYIQDKRDNKLLAEAHSHNHVDRNNAAGDVAEVLALVYKMLIQSHGIEYITHVRADVYVDEATYELLVEAWNTGLRDIVELHHSDLPHDITLEDGEHVRI